MLRKQIEIKRHELEESRPRKAERAVPGEGFDTSRVWNQSNWWERDPVGPQLALNAIILGKQDKLHQTHTRPDVVENTERSSRRRRGRISTGEATYT